MKILTSKKNGKGAVGVEVSYNDNSRGDFFIRDNSPFAVCAYLLVKDCKQEYSIISDVAHCTDEKAKVIADAVIQSESESNYSTCCEFRFDEKNSNKVYLTFWEYYNG